MKAVAIPVLLLALSPVYVARPFQGRDRGGESAALQGFDVRTYGAQGDGKTLDTDAINKAIAINIPSYGLYARHVKTLSARDMVFTLERPDARPAFRFDSVAGVDLERLIVPHASAPVFSLRSVTDFFHRNSPGLPDKRLATVDKDAF
jgi:hypothetical protein